MNKFVSTILLSGLLTAGSAMAAPISVTPTTDATALVSTLLGPGISLVGTPTFSGADGSAGIFTSGEGTGLGFSSGIVLSSGLVTDVVGPNGNGGTVETISGGGTSDEESSGASTEFGTAGDADLDVLSGDPTFDASILTFDFTSDGGDLFFRYVFGSEEYIDFIDSDVNDVFGFFLDGVNIALIPGTSDPVSIDTVNPGDNSGFYRNNIENSEGLSGDGTLDMEYDGFTTVLTASALDLAPGTHTIKLAISDAGDGILDSGVFIEASSFTDRPNDVPEPGSLVLMLGSLIALRVASAKSKS